MFVCHMYHSLFFYAGFSLNLTGFEHDPYNLALNNFQFLVDSLNLDQAASLRKLCSIMTVLRLLFKHKKWGNEDAALQVRQCKYFFLESYEEKQKQL